MVRSLRLPLDNEQVARRLDEIAALLEAEYANPFRVAAYRHAAEIARGLARPLREILRERGRSGLVRLPGIGESLSTTIETLVRTGRVPLLERLRERAGSGDVFLTVPGIGPNLARRIHDELGIDALAELEAAANDGRLERVPGVGRERSRTVRSALAPHRPRGSGGPDRAGRSAPGSGLRPDAAAGARGARGTRRAHGRAIDEPPVAELLDVDREYRAEAARRRLPRIAPQRFNPTHEAWLPILRTTRGKRRYSALYSNTARAHELGATHDWVVVHRDDAGGASAWTVVTSHLGRLGGRRLVVGRERECREHYDREERRRRTRATAREATAPSSCAGRARQQSFLP